MYLKTRIFWAGIYHKSDLKYMFLKVYHNSICKALEFHLSNPNGVFPRPLLRTQKWSHNKDHGLVRRVTFEPRGTSFTNHPPSGELRMTTVFISVKTLNTSVRTHFGGGIVVFTHFTASWLGKLTNIDKTMNSKGRCQYTSLWTESQESAVMQQDSSAKNTVDEK